MAGETYWLDVSADLETWVHTGIVEPGTGSTVIHAFSSSAEALFYRVRTFNDEFLVLPVDGQVVEVIDGVCFAFDLNLGIFPELPAKIRIYSREYGVGAAWDHIGTITEFADIDGIQFVRGSVVWLPGVEGNYEVHAEVADDTDAVVAIAARRVTVNSNTPPIVAITAGPSPPFSEAKEPVFETEITGTTQEIARVEFYDNGVFMGIDHEAPFGDVIADLAGQTQTFVHLWRGTHNITAVAYDCRGIAGPPSDPYVVEISVYNASPQFQYVSPAYQEVEQGQSAVIEYEATDEDPNNGLYQIWAQKQVGVSDSNPFPPPAITVTPPTPVIIDTTDWEPGNHIIKVSAVDMSLAASYTEYVRIYVSETVPATFPQTLVAELVDETSLVVSNEYFSGIEASSGVFADGEASGLEMDAGVLFTSGSFELWNAGLLQEATSEYDDPSFINFEEPGDLPLDCLIEGTDTRDAATLEFDAISQYSQLEIEYQFGSEEYTEFVSDFSLPNCFNDGFYLAVDGTVVSLLPDCSDLVGVASVHPFIPEEPSPCLSADLPAEHEEIYLDDIEDIQPNVTGTRVEYDGMTIRLRIHVLVAVSQNHRVRISIADVNDDRLDSALFLESTRIRSVLPVP